MVGTKDLVLVTGGSGFIGSHTALAALKDGFRVRTTVRSLERADGVRELLLNGGASKEQVDGVEFIAADLMKDDGWTEACIGCKYLLHVASPFPATVPKDENELIIPARDGTLRILRAAKAAGTIKRVVITSSLAAIAYGHSSYDRAFTEEDWTELDSGIPVPAYQKSKTIAERAAWDFIKKDGNGLELATINPVGVLGPVLGKSAGTSIDIVVQMLQGKLPLLPKLTVGWVDVRDVALLHIRAMTKAEANGQRFVASSEDASLRQIAVVLKDKLGAQGSKVSTWEAPNMVVKLMAYVDQRVGLVADELDKVKRCDNSKTKSVLDWSPISVEEAIVTAAQSSIKYGLV